MSDTINEKYISIEYEKWESYYKPLEQINMMLQREVDHFKNDNKITITLRADRYDYNRGIYEKNIGYLDVGTIPYNVKINRKDFKSLVEGELGIKLEKNQEDIKKEGKILEAKEKIDNLPRIVKFLFNIKY